MSRQKSVNKKIQLHGSVSEDVANEIESYIEDHPLIKLNGLVGELIRRGWESVRSSAGGDL